MDVPEAAPAISPRGPLKPARASAVLAGLAAVTLASPAFAQVAGGVSLQTDYRLRGYSISGQDGVAVLDVSYDHASGFYANGSMIGGRRDGDNLTVVGLIGNVGYARRLTPRLTLDTGLVRVDHLQHYGPDTTGRYTEGYVGAAMGAVSARVSYSPDYLRRGVKTLYSEVNGGLDLAAKLRLSGHLGYLGCLDAPTARPCYDRYDWRVGLSRQFDRLELHASLSGAKASSGQTLRLGHDPALVLGAAWTF